METVRFQIPECLPAEVSRLERELGVSGPLAQVLVRRGLADPARALEFFAAEEEHDGAQLSGLAEAIEPILQHVRDATRITIHGDYDVDGVCSTAVLVCALRGLGANVDWYLPDRASDGYGLNRMTVERLATRGTRLLITADCGIGSVEEVAAARALGLDVVLSDHHAPRADGVLPDAPIVHPALGGYPTPELCATAVAHKLARGLWLQAGRDPRGLDEHLDLVALATIADVVPLLGENRTLVRRGLRTLAGTLKPGLRALMAVARVDPSRVDEHAVGFALAPRINAAGRLYRADAGLELILTEDPVRAAQIAEELDHANRERRHTETHIRLQAEAQIAQLGSNAERFAYVLAGEGWHPGVIGIVAARLAERHHRPVVLIALDGGSGRGSGRSIEGYDLLAGLTECAGHMLGYGGHRAAAGLQIESARVGDLATALAAHAERALTREDLVALERVDAVVAGEQLGMTLAEELARLAPFGRGNPAVSLMVKDAIFRDVRAMGEGKHARFTVQSDGAHVRAVAFGTGTRLPARAVATFRLEVNDYNGVSEPRLVLRHARPCQANDAAALAGEADQVGSPAELALF